MMPFDPPSSLFQIRLTDDVVVVKDAEDLNRLQKKTLTILSQAERSRERRLVLLAIREARANLELLARLLGELKEAQVNLVVAPQWVTLKAVILNALEPFPTAKLAVIRALEGGDEEASRE